MIAKSEKLNIKTVRRDMRDLSVFSDESFDLIINPVPNVFVLDISPVWKEAASVLKSGGLYY